MGYTIRNAGYIGKAWVTGTSLKTEGGILNTDLARFTPDETYSFTSHTFTTCGATGREGPTESNCDTAYAGEVWLTDYFSVSNGIQKWTVPKTTSYTFTVRGASGGKGYAILGGKPRILKGTVNLNKGDQIEILIGQQGVASSGSCTDAGGGGGGGTFVYNETTSTLLFAAGGGGGGARQDNSSNHNAPSSTSGNAGVGMPSGAPGGTGGGGGTTAEGGTHGCVDGGGGGGGYDGDGTTTSDKESEFGEGFLQGGKGGDGHEKDGGFGGGGSSGLQAAGGGGGYSGGGGGCIKDGFTPECSCQALGSGGAGGSYIITDATSETNLLYDSSLTDGSCTIVQN